MNTIIFGKSGFLGHNLQLEGLSPSSKQCNLLDYHSVFRYLSENVGITEPVKIVNLAANVAGALYNKNHNLEMLYENTIISLNLIKAIYDLNLDCYYLYLSSVCAYDNDNIMKEHRLFEGLPAKNNFGYGVAKKFGILAAESLKIDKPNFRFCSLVPTNMYGQYDNCSLQFGHVIPNLFMKMMNKDNKKIDILGNCSNLRNFLYAKDMGKVIEYFVNKELEGTYNVASDESISIFNLANEIKKITNYDGELVFNYTDLIDSRYISNNKLRTILGREWKFTSLSEGLENTYKWMVEK